MQLSSGSRPKEIEMGISSHSGNTQSNRTTRKLRDAVALYVVIFSLSFHGRVNLLQKFMNGNASSSALA